MKKNWYIAVCLAGMLGLSSHAAFALVIAVDLDPGTAGIQDTLTVANGASFTVDVVLANETGDSGNTLFNITNLSVSFNDAGAVIGFDGVARAGDIAGNTFLVGAGVAQDLFKLSNTIVPDDPLTLSTNSEPPDTGFSSDTDQVGLSAELGFSFPASADITTLFSFDFTAIAEGVSTLRASNTVAPGAELSQGGSPLSPNLLTATITVQASGPTVPEPASLALLGLGLFAFGFGRKITS